MPDFGDVLARRFATLRVVPDAQLATVEARAEKARRREAFLVWCKEHGFPPAAKEHLRAPDAGRLVSWQTIDPLTFPRAVAWAWRTHAVILRGHDLAVALRYPHDEARRALAVSAQSAPAALLIAPEWCEPFEHLIDARALASLRTCIVSRDPITALSARWPNIGEP